MHNIGGRNPQISLRLGSVMLQWTDKLKYLGVFFCINTCHVDVQTGVRKFYGSFNNVMSVLGKARNEMTSVYLMERYCLPIINYASEFGICPHLSLVKLILFEITALEKYSIAVGVKVHRACSFTVIVFL